MDDAKDLRRKYGKSGRAIYGGVPEFAPRVVYVSVGDEPGGKNRWRYYTETRDEETAQEHANKLASRGRRAMVVDKWMGGEFVW